MGSYTFRCVRSGDSIPYEDGSSSKEEPLMPTTLSTRVRPIYDRVPDSVNSKLIEDFHSYLKEDITVSVLNALLISSTGIFHSVIS
jgi:hypothetical protein